MHLTPQFYSTTAAPNPSQKREKKKKPVALWYYLPILCLDTQTAGATPSGVEDVYYQARNNE
jgi:hypothetical protein